LASRKVRRRSFLGTSLGAAVIVIVLRMAGLLQGLELFAYDHLLRQRRPEAQDDRFLMVTVNAASGSFLRDSMLSGRYEPGLGTIPDKALNEALIELSQKKARLIGLDFYRDFPADSRLAPTLANTESLVALCKAGYGGKGNIKPPEVALAQIGFNDLKSDLASGTEFVRRHLIMQDSDPEFCPTSSSFSLLLARRYLEQEGVEFVSPEAPEGGFFFDELMLGEQIIPNLHLGVGPYYPPNLDNAIFGGYQTLLNFRLTQTSISEEVNLERFAETVSLRALLNGDVPQSLIEDRIVMLGYVDATDRNTDFWETPYGGMAGVLLQAQMASQLISTALDGRSLIRWWPLHQEALWILAWAIAGGLLIRQFSGLKRLILLGSGGAVLIYGFCYVAMVYGTLWISLVPPTAAFTSSALGVAALKYRLHRS